MPRGFALTLIPGSTPDHQIDQMVSNLLEPHVYYFEFEPFRTPCLNCGVTSEEGIHAANQQVGDFHRLYHQYRSTPVDQRPEWKDYIYQWEEKAIQAARESPHYQEPDPDCDHCWGTGVATERCPPNGLRYESRSMVRDEWQIMDPDQTAEISPVSYEIILTPDGQAHRRWGWESLSEEEWSQKTQKLLQEHPGSKGVLLLINI